MNGPDMQRLGRIIAAEARRIWASRIPLAFLITSVMLVLVFAFELMYVERLGEHLHPRSAMDTLPVLVFSTWKTLLFLAALIPFCAFWMTVDSQYGMVRSACTQPVRRSEYFVGKCAAICAYALLFGATYVLAQVVVATAHSGIQGMTWSDVGRLARFSTEMLAFIVALALAVMSCASVRRTVGGGIVVGYLVVVGLALMTMLPHSVIPPQFVLMRHFFFALQEFGDPFAAFGSGDSVFIRTASIANFVTTIVCTPLLFLVPAMLYFNRRDITE
jgi:ABC-type transport system involved in multi-copper enzyme maturation permease subunit